jgi:RNA polymerase sigma-32 factor
MRDNDMAVIQNDLNSFDGTGAQAYARGYASTIRQFDLLEQEEEQQQLARRWQELGGRRATEALITSHLRLAAKVVRREHYHSDEITKSTTSSCQARRRTRSG